LTEDCEQEANKRLLDPSNNQCDIYDQLSYCMQENVEENCGKNAWDVYFRLFVVDVRRHVLERTLFQVKLIKN
jgi:hypothetical protein